MHVLHTCIVYENPAFVVLSAAVKCQGIACVATFLQIWLYGFKGIGYINT